MNFRDSINTKVGWITVHCSERGLVELTFRRSSENHSRHHLVRLALKQVGEYVSGKRRQFDVPLDLQGTKFQLDVWNALLEIPFGTLTSYQAIAKAVGRPLGARAVGGAVGKNPVPVIVPCHRVVRSSGDLGGFSSGLKLKRMLLEIEGLRACLKNSSYSDWLRKPLLSSSAFGSSTCLKARLRGLSCASSAALFSLSLTT